mmetsp:Transcript_2948/g.5266  ORF Transcript_2948/g.5266 Transcript_2948/m.5266 type:complete len:90 (-) Transcript_2948:141-410(-)
MPVQCAPFLYIWLDCIVTAGSSEAGCFGRALLVCRSFTNAIPATSNTAPILPTTMPAVSPPPRELLEMLELPPPPPPPNKGSRGGEGGE